MVTSLDQNLPLPEFHAETALRLLDYALAEEIKKTRVEKAVIGVSGGIDSALSLALTCRAIGPENILALLMPYETSHPDSLRHGRMVCDSLGVKVEIADISQMANAWFANKPNMSRSRKGNIMARLRMLLLYDYSAEENALVIGTSNKTEILLGYSTLWGDMASAVNPLGDMYKNHVRLLSAYLNIPTPLIEKAPSADLWEGQTDEAELAVSYDIADRILYHYIDLHYSRAELFQICEQCGIEREKVSNIFNRVMSSQFKRKMPVIIKLSSRTVNREFRNPRDWNLYQRKVRE